MKANHTHNPRREAARKARRANRKARRTSQSMHAKASHVLAPEICVLHVERLGYFVGIHTASMLPGFTPDPEEAMRFSSDGVTRQANNLRKDYGLRATVRAYKPQRAAPVVSCHCCQH